VRVGVAKRAWLPLQDRGNPAQNTLIATAKTDGVGGNQISVEVQNAPNTLVTMVAESAVAAALAAGAMEVDLANAAEVQKYKVADVVSLMDANNSERLTVAKVVNDAVADHFKLQFKTGLQNAYAANSKIRLGDLVPLQIQLRVDNVAGFVPGTTVVIAQNAVAESRTVRAVDKTNNFLTLTQALSKTYSLDPAAVGGANQPAQPTVTAQGFTLKTARAGEPDEIFWNITLDPRDPRYFPNIVKNSTRVELKRASPPSTTAPPTNNPKVLAPTKLGSDDPLHLGVDDNLAQIAAKDYRDAIDSLKRIDDVNILCMPDGRDLDLQLYLIDHCQNMQDRFAVLDADLGMSNADLAQRKQSLVSDTGVAALYAPWIMVPNPAGEGRLVVPPSGHVAGIYARVDTNVGVFKAPANETVRGAVDLERQLGADEQGPLNEQNINIIRFFPGRGIRVWGARTVSDTTQWRFVNVRRLLLFIEKSIQLGTLGFVFAPNNLSLWQQIRRQVGDFLTRVYKDGALFGATADQAFRVRVDEELNPPGQRALGQLVIEVIVVPTTPAEFIVFRVISDTTGSVLLEKPA
jgi:uncharacterized protein